MTSDLCAEADLRIGELQWGDSGVYFCKVVIANDLEGKNEGQMELLVLGMSTFNQSNDDWTQNTPSLIMISWLACIFVCLFGIMSTSVKTLSTCG